MKPHADILLVTATEVETKAVFESFREATNLGPVPHQVGKKMYHNLGVVNGNCVFLAQSEMGSGGLGASLQTVEKGITALTPQAVIMVGIAFGVNEQKQAVGDILISRQLWLYDLQRVGADRIVPRGDKPHASPWLLDRCRSAVLYWEGAEVRFGLVLTGEKLVDNVDYRDQLHQFEPEAIGGEMEGAGLYTACQDAKVDWILVKAICDWADGKKGANKQQRQTLAAHNAARFVLHMLQYAALEHPDQDSPETRTATQSDPRKRTIEVELRTQTIEFLLRLRLSTPAARETLLLSASLDDRLLQQIDSSLPLAQFVPLLIAQAAAYGMMSDGRDALEAVLLASRELLGLEGQTACDVLLQKWQNARTAMVPAPDRPQGPRSTDHLARLRQDLARQEELFHALDLRLHELLLKEAKMGSLFPAGEAVELREAEQEAQQLQEAIQALRAQIEETTHGQA